MIAIQPSNKIKVPTRETNRKLDHSTTSTARPTSNINNILFIYLPTKNHLKNHYIYIFLSHPHHLPTRITTRPNKQKPSLVGKDHYFGVQGCVHQDRLHVAVFPWNWGTLAVVDHLPRMTKRHGKHWGWLCGGQHFSTCTAASPLLKATSHV